MKNIEILRSLGRIKNFEKDELLFAENDPGDEMYIALSGSFGIYMTSFAGFPIKVTSIKPPQCFGEMSVIDGWLRSATIIAEEKSTAMLIHKDNFGCFVETSHDLVLVIIKTLYARAVSALKKAREMGHEVSDLPMNLQNPALKDPVTDMSTMVQLSKRIRELNEVLGADKVATINVKQDVDGTDMLTLRPAGHPVLSEVDSYDSSKLLGGKKYVCPYCYKGFESKIPLVSRLVHEKTSLDQRVHYSNFNGLLYANIVCPNCNYCDAIEEFARIPFSDAALTPQVSGNQFKNIEGFTGFKDEVSHTYDEAVLSYLLQFNCLNQVQNSEMRQAKALHRLYWIYSDCNKKEAAVEFARNAITYYKIHIEKRKVKLTTNDIITFNVIMAKLHLGIGEKEKALELFKENTIIGKGMKDDLVLQSYRIMKEIAN